MKKLSLLFFAAFFALTNLAWSQVTIHYWNFNDSPPPASGLQWPSPIAEHSGIGSGSLSHNFTDVQSFAGSTLNQESSDVTGAGGSFCPRGAANGQSFVLTVPTTGYTSPILSYATRTSGATGFTTQLVEYSTDGTNYSATTFTNSGMTSTFATFTVTFTDVAANNNANFKIRVTFSGSTASTGNNRVDNLKLTATAPLNDGDGTAVLSNVIGSGNLNNTSVFPASTSGQSVKVAVTGSSAGTLTSVSVTIPLLWGWDGTSVAPSGDDGATLTGLAVSGNGTSTPYTITYNGTITNTNIARITISNLTSANPSAITDNGNYSFIVKTAKASGTLTSIASSPVLYVIIPISHIRNQSSGVPVLISNNVATSYCRILYFNFPIAIIHTGCYIRN